MMTLCLCWGLPATFAPVAALLLFLAHVLLILQKYWSLELGKKPYRFMNAHVRLQVQNEFGADFAGGMCRCLPEADTWHQVPRHHMPENSFLFIFPPSRPSMTSFLILRPGRA